jgi:hypothetical protein
VTQRCKRASCEECGPGYRRRVGKIAATGDPYSILTFTAPPGIAETPADQARELVKHALAFRRHWNTQRPKQRVEWFWSLEEHKSGWPHLHLLVVGGFLPIKLLRAWMWKRMRARNTSIQRIRNAARAKAYVTKYVAKSLEKFQSIARWGRSRGYGAKLIKVESFPELAGASWERLHDNSPVIVHRWLMRGHRIDPTIKWCTVLRHPP